MQKRFSQQPRASRSAVDRLKSIGPLASYFFPSFVDHVILYYFSTYYMYTHIYINIIMHNRVRVSRKYGAHSDRGGRRTVPAFYGLYPGLKCAPADTRVTLRPCVVPDYSISTRWASLNARRRHRRSATATGPGAKDLRNRLVPHPRVCVCVCV